MKIETVELSVNQKYMLVFHAESPQAYRDLYTEKFKQMLLDKEALLVFPDDIKLIIFN